MNEKLKVVWEKRAALYAKGDKLRAERAKLRAEGTKLYAQGAKLRAEGDNLYAQGAALYAEGDNLYAEGDNLRAEGDKVWLTAIIAEYGNVPLSWQEYSCIIHLPTGDLVFGKS